MVDVTVIRVFEPALCCNTGVCGPDVDEALVAFTADLDHLRAEGVDIERHNLANDPGAFAANDAVRDFLQVAGSEGLPLTVVDGVTVQTGGYPSRSQLRRYAGLAEPGAVAGPDSEALPSVVPVGVASLLVSDGGDTGCGCGPSGCC